MPKKPPRERKVSQFKGNKPNARTATGQQDFTAKTAKGKVRETLEQEQARFELTNRSTSSFSSESLGALMQVAPGEAEPHQINKQTRQFKQTPKIDTEN